MSGPFSATIDLYQSKLTNCDSGVRTNCRIWSRVSTWYRSGNRKKHASAPLPYSVRVGDVYYTAGCNQSCDSRSARGLATLTDSRWNNLFNGAINRAREKFISAAQDQASSSIGETLGEWTQSRDMIANRLKQLTDFAVGLRRRDWRKVKSALGVPLNRRQKRTVRDKAKSFGDKWLEFHLGWAPLVGDIYSAFDALSRDFSPTTCRGRANAYDNLKTVTSTSTNKVTTIYDVWVGVLVQAKVHVVNPNQALLAQLGLVNPVTVAWNLVPYSFVVDWFVDVGGFISQLDGLLGLETVDAFYTTYKRGHVAWSDVYTGPNPLYAKYSNYAKDRGFRVDRNLGIPSYSFVYPTIPRFSWQRAATAISLLLQHL